MAVPINLGILYVGVLRIRALLFGVHIRAPDFCKLPSEGIDLGSKAHTVDDINPASPPSIHIYHTSHGLGI